MKWKKKPTGNMIKTDACYLDGSPIYLDPAKEICMDDVEIVYPLTDFGGLVGHGNHNRIGLGYHRQARGLVDDQPRP